MTKDSRNVLTVLKRELEYLESGGYRQPWKASWRPQFVFEDSPTCLNPDPTKPRVPCSECAMSEFVPDAAASKKFPCRYIPLNEQGETIDYFYRGGTRDDLEKNLSQWLRDKIRQLEATHSANEPWIETPEIHIKAKCAKP